MIVVLLNIYLVLLFCLVKLKIVPFNLFWKISPVLVFLLLLIGLFIPMNWGAPQGTALVVRNSVAIVPDVAGEVVEVPVVANTPLKAGDVLFRIDPVPFQSQVDALQAQLTGARWNLDKTTVRAPADGYVTNLALRKGARVSSLPLAPVMAFIDTSQTIIGVEINQIDARYIQPGQPIEATFKFAPGRIFSGKVESVLQAVASGQTQVTGAAVAPGAIRTMALAVRVRLDDTAFADALPAGSTGTAAIFTERVKMAHVIRKVLLRQVAILNYINPF